MRRVQVDLETPTLSELIQLKSDIAETLTRRFQRRLALAFSDIVGSTEYFARHGDAAGRALHQRHIDTLRPLLARHGGRIVDTAGDGAFLAFDDVHSALLVLMHLHRALAQAPALVSGHRLVVRTGLHCGPVLTDGTIVSGDAVNQAARVTSTAYPQQIRITRDVMAELPAVMRIQCAPLDPVELKGIAGKVLLFSVPWGAAEALPDSVRIEETGEIVRMPERDVVTFGRLAETYADGTRANDVVLRAPDPRITERISRWHFEVRRTQEGLALRSLTDQPTSVDGVLLAKGASARVTNGTTVTVSRVLTLTFVAPGAGETGDPSRRVATAAT